MTSHCAPLRRRCCLLALALIVGGTAVAHSQVEIGGSAEPPVSYRNSSAPPPESRFGPTFGWLFLNEQVMSETYGSVAIPGLMFTADLSQDTRFVMGAGRGFARGNPFHDVTGFEGVDAAELTMIPLQIGLQSDLAPHPRLHILCGLSAELVWMQERLAAAAVAGSADHVDYDGWGEGLRVSFGPEWRSADARRVIGFAMNWGASGGEVHGGRRRHEVNLTGTGLQFHILWRL
ncbi:MAG: hypothetical protein Q7W56_06610 [Candidatus Latescibacteria bacterium]|nr:hypothetical protein [Candidatus Latescibacterota bacterium]